MSYIFFLLGFISLILGANWLIDGAVSLAQRFKISEIIVGLTIIAFGTSAPELVVNLISSLQGNSELVVGNIIGSNIANLGLVLGTAGIFTPIVIHPGLNKKEIPLGLFGAIAIYLLAQNSGAENFLLSHFAGGILLAGFIGFLFFIYQAKKNEKKIEKLAIAKYSFGVAISLILVGLIGLTLGGKLVVNNALIIAQQFGISESLIGLSLIALGTSLPELVTSLVAVFKKKMDLALGNVVGSNVFNIFWVLGMSAVIRPIVFNTQIIFDLAVLIGITLFLMVSVFIGRRHELAQWQAGILLMSYVGYIWFIFLRG
jgi:cation:H+ antiporter